MADQVEPFTAEQVEYINRRWGQLHELEERAVEQAYRYLFLTNSGGAVAVLAYIAQRGDEARTPLVLGMLVCFVLGVVLVGLGLAKTYEHMSGLYKDWKRDTRRFFARELSFNELTKSDDARAVTDWLDRALPYGALLAFFAGCGVGAVALWCSAR